jgi:hypothetical protein
MEHADFCSAITKGMVSGKEDIHCKERHEKSVIKLSFIGKVMDGLNSLQQERLEEVLTTAHEDIPALVSWGELVGFKRYRETVQRKRGRLWGVDKIELEESILVIHPSAVVRFVRDEIESKKNFKAGYLFLKCENEPRFCIYVEEGEYEEAGLKTNSWTVIGLRPRNKELDDQLARSNLRKIYVRYF